MFEIGLPPRERLITSAPWSVAQLTPVATSASLPEPSSPRTRTGRILASGAAPSIPIPLPSSAAMIPLTWVPWPLPSRVTGPAGEDVVASQQAAGEVGVVDHGARVDDGDGGPGALADLVGLVGVDHVQAPLVHAQRVVGGKARRRQRKRRRKDTDRHPYPHAFEVSEQGVRRRRVGAISRTPRPFRTVRSPSVQVDADASKEASEWDASRVSRGSRELQVGGGGVD